MKKYQRLLLIIVSIISLSLFLIYRHHYNRLHHVLEVFNFFGTPCNLSQLQQNEKDLVEFDWGPQPLWQQVDSEGYVFGAFYLDKNKVEGIGVRHGSLTIPKTCFLYFDDENRPSKGKFTIARTNKDKSSGFVIYNYSCAINSDKIPFSITFMSKTEQKNVTMLVTNTLHRKVSLNITVCITPGIFSKKLLLEFLSFHNLLGVDSFIVYFDQNIPHSLMKLLKNLSRTLNMWISFFPYNLPILVPKNVTSSLIEYDCQLRTKVLSRHSLVLDINEYVVPALPLNSKSDGPLRLPIKKFCLNHVNKDRPMILQNFELVDDYNFNEIKKVNVNNENTDALLKTIPNMFDSSCTIHRYEKCEKHLKTKTDFSVKRYSTDFTRSTLVQLLIHEEIDM